ncbi:MAG: hypothetical protein EBY22_02180 [Gammaproteobacteria bacterium]|nr:hypothetical protein [Gammaproteobacteria bacterium]
MACQPIWNELKLITLIIKIFYIGAKGRIHIFIFSDTLKSFESFYRTLAFNPPLAKIEVGQNQ